MSRIFTTVACLLLATTAVQADEPKPYYELPDPLFAPLLGDTPTPQRTLYWSAITNDKHDRSRRWLAAHAKKFGHRFVFTEQLEETARLGLVVRGVQRPALEHAGIVTWRDVATTGPTMPYISLRNDAEQLPNIVKGGGWMMDPRWLRQYVGDAASGASQNGLWALMAGDEIWEGKAITPIAPENRYKQVLDADAEIRRDYGFGRFGMPDSKDDSDPFKRIAHRRWVSDRLTPVYRDAYRAAKQVNPDIVMVSPDFSGGVPAADIEAWAPYFDAFAAQTDNGPFPFLFRTGCDTKLLVDLAGGKPVWMSVHTAKELKYGWTVSPEDVIERFSQVFRNGGNGLWLLATEWWEGELMHPKFAEPAKWRAMVHALETMKEMTLPRLPDQADCAILYCSDTMLTNPFAKMTWMQWELDGAYTVLGPVLRSWFHFVSDRQILRGQHDLSDYKVLYVPLAQYTRPAVLDRLTSYVEGGGTLVVTDVEAFDWNINGERMNERFEKLCGVRKLKQRQADSSVSTTSATPLTIETLVPAWDIEPLSENVQALGTYPDGSPAISSHPYGRGRVIFFAADPFAEPGGWQAKRSLIHPPAPIIEFIRAIQAEAGATMGHDIWRFKLPPFPGDPYQHEKGRCLTNNYVYDRNPPLRNSRNVDTAGSYTYSFAPTGIPDVADTGEPVPFTDGKLTNRVAAWQSRQSRPDYDHTALPKMIREWIVSWPNRGIPHTITFDLKSEYDITKVRFFYSEVMPATTVRGSRDGQTWESQGTAPTQIARVSPLLELGQDVIDVTVPIEGTYRYVQLSFDARDAGEEFQLCEVEIWGE